jgi:hypothetical protein
MAVSILGTLFKSAKPVARSNDRVELTVTDLESIETFLHASDHFLGQLGERSAAGSGQQGEVRELIERSQLLLVFAQERVAGARHRLANVARCKAEAN